VDLSILAIVVVSYDSSAWVHLGDDLLCCDPIDPLALDSNADTSVGGDSNYEYGDMIDDLKLDLLNSKRRISQSCKATSRGVNRNSLAKKF
jgi:hypothetical protein